MKKVPLQEIKVQKDGSRSFIASYPPSNSHMSNETREGAIEDLQSFMWTEYLSLKDDPDERLGPAMRIKRDELKKIFEPEED